MTDAPPDPVIAMSSVSFRRDGRKILRDIDWRVEQGEHWAVIGANGSGKTTLLQVAGGVLFPTAGTVTVLGCRFGAADLFLLRRRIGWVSSALNARTPRGETALATVASGLKATFGTVCRHSPADADKAADRLARVGLAGRENALFGVLSHGEQQKVLFARALMADPELLILDEPCSGLDLKAREAFLETVEDAMSRRSATVVMVTHHTEEIPPGVGKALALMDGGVLAAGAAELVLVPETLSKAFGVAVEVRRDRGRFWTGIGARCQ